MAAALLGIRPRRGYVHSATRPHAPTAGSWHGNTFRADQVLSWLEDELCTDTEDESPPEAEVKLAKYLDQFATYLGVNAYLMPNYAEPHRCGEAISSALAESAVNQIVAERMAKKPQMRWSPAGAQLLLQVRTAVHNNDLASSSGAGTRASRTMAARPRSRSTSRIGPRDHRARGGLTFPDPNGLPTTQLHQQLVFRPTRRLGCPETPIAGLYLARRRLTPAAPCTGHAARTPRKPRCMVFGRTASGSPQPPSGMRSADNPYPRSRAPTPKAAPLDDTGQHPQ
jgi:hypothetical protein